MNQRVIADPSQHGWVEVDGKWVWDADGGAGAGMVISETEPTDPVEGMQWLNPNTGLVLFWDDSKWLQMPTTGAAGKDGVDGVDGLWTDEGNDSISYDGNVGIGPYPPMDGHNFGLGKLDGPVLSVNTSAKSRGQEVTDGYSSVVRFNGYADNTYTDYGAVSFRCANFYVEGTATFSGNVNANNATFNSNLYTPEASVGNSGVDTDRKQVLRLGASRPWSFVQNGTGGSQRLQLYAEAGGNKVFSIGGLDAPSENVIEFFSGTGDIGAKGSITGSFLRGTHVIQAGSPVVDAKGLIKTLSTLRQATLDETQDIRESLRSAIDELVAGFEQDIAAMPAEVSE